MSDRDSGVDSADDTSGSSNKDQDMQDDQEVLSFLPNPMANILIDSTLSSNINNNSFVSLSNQSSLEKNYDIPSTSKRINSFATSFDINRELQMSITEINNDVAISPTITNVNLCGFNFKMKQNDLNSLWDFYRNSNNSFNQHSFIPKIKSTYKKKNRKSDIYSNYLNDERLLRNASNSGDIVSVRRFLASGVDVNASDERQRTALHLATTRGHHEIALALLKNGADPNKKDLVGNTPLHLAVCSSKLDMVIILLENGASCHSSDISGRTPMQLAKSKLSYIAKSIEKNSIDSPEKFKIEAIKISIMLGVYFEKCKQERKNEIESFRERISTRQNNQEIESDVNSLLECLESWAL